MDILPGSRGLWLRGVQLSRSIKRIEIDLVPMAPMWARDAQTFRLGKLWYISEILIGKKFTWKNIRKVGIGQGSVLLLKRSALRA